MDPVFRKRLFALVSNFAGRLIHQTLVIHIVLVINHSFQLHSPAAFHLKVIPWDLLEKWFSFTSVMLLTATFIFYRRSLFSRLGHSTRN